MAELIKYIEVTDENGPDGVRTGVHSVAADWKVGQQSSGESWRFITEAEARIANPALFGIAPDAVAPTDAEIAEQIAVLQAQLAPVKPVKE